MPYSLGDGIVLHDEIATGNSGRNRIFKGSWEPYGDVCVKLIPPYTDPEDEKRNATYFKREVEYGEVLTGPCVRKFLRSGIRPNWREIGYPKGVKYLVFEWLECGLDDRLRRSRLDANEIRGLVARVGSGLSDAHYQPNPIVHRDLKPANILLADGTCATAKLADFGIAIVPGDKRLTTSAWVGTDLYMAPEQFNPASVLDTRTDVYSFALMIWEWLTGDVPMSDQRDLDGTRFRRREPFIPQELIVEGKRRKNLEVCLHKCLAREPGARLANGRMVRDAVLSAGATDGVWTMPNAASARSLTKGLIEDNRNSGGALWVYLKADSLELLSRASPGVHWTYASVRRGWWTKDRRAAVSRLHRVLADARQVPSVLSTLVSRDKRSSSS
jgi:serine/threonine protein kinase